MDIVYDLCVVGAGMIGSAAARYSSCSPSFKVCLIGPSEPKVKEIITGHEAFGAHYDEARITRQSAKYPVWAKLAQRSINSYAYIEQQSGIKFYHEVGNLNVGETMDQILENAQRDGVMKDIKPLTNDELKSYFPYMDFGLNDIGLHEFKRAGYINPRKLVQAQIQLASQQGCDVIRDTVVNLQDKGNYVQVVTSENKTVKAYRVLLATNVFTRVFNLLGKEISLESSLMPQTVSLLEVSKEDAIKLRNMPCVMYTGTGGPNWPRTYPRNTDGILGFYMLPPVTYPDGKMYIKIGHRDDIVSPLSCADVQRWYTSPGDKVLEQHLSDIARAVLPDIDFLSHHGESCVTMTTPTHHPYIDKVTSNIGICLGDNGWAAKSSNEIGRIAALMMMKNTWTYNISSEVFQIKCAASKL